MSWDINKFYKEGYFYRSKSPEWKINLYGFAVDGLGDLLYNTLRKIKETNDKSEWAYSALLECADLLFYGKRWPDRLNPPTVPGKEPYRSQFSITRDPFIALYACAIHLNRKQFIQVKPPWWLYSPEFNSWRRALLGKRNCYKLLRRITPGRRDFVKALDDLMWNAYKQNRKR